MKDLKDQVVVITGASSGIGRATALEFAGQGAKVVVAGRDAAALREVELEITESGGTAEPVIADVTKEEQVERLAAKATEAYGHIDIWINNAAVSLFAKFDEAPADDYRQVIETDFFGYVYGARAALKRFKVQGHGTIINVDSIEGIAPKPYNSAYAAAKHAVRALASSLRMELALDGAKDIHVCTVLPASVDTPLFAHAANYTGQGVAGSHSASPPSQVATAIAKLARHPERELIMHGAKGSAVKYMATPSLYERVTAKAFPRRHLTSESVMPASGNLYEPTGPHAIHGAGESQEHGGRSKFPLIAVAAAVVAAGGLATWLLWPGSKRTTGLKKMVPKLGH